MNKITIRQEIPSDYPAVFELVKSAFEKIEHSDKQEQFLVERLRKSKNFIPELSLVAEVDGEVVGYILLTEISIVDKGQLSGKSLALAPVAVLNEYQGMGIGGKLILEAQKRAKDLGYESVILLGHEGYYPKFGYQKAELFEIYPPFEVPSENFMAIELSENALKNIKGIVQYPAEFGI